MGGRQGRVGGRQSDKGHEADLEMCMCVGCCDAFHGNAKIWNQGFA